ncbi:hypothetical protein A9Q75_01710 [Colwellia psychrerythraea]|uniref:Uncharacterized protein n=1 Tax=Colwellia psychrerythraea TaxID=28229 RepID=A0A1Y5EQB7_COLPS|nr:hypothetical protein A9Q75_01710 [Colwellia psychrerythraea]
MSEPMSEKESETLSRCIKIDDWIFEIKTVRAIRVEEYGQPYSAIVNFNFNGDSVYVDGFMNNSDVDLTKEDFDTLKGYVKRLGAKQIQFDRYKNKQSTAHSWQSTADSWVFSPIESKPQPLQLVSAG